MIEILILLFIHGAVSFYLGKRHMQKEYDKLATQYAIMYATLVIKSKLLELKEKGYVKL